MMFIRLQAWEEIPFVTPAPGQDAGRVEGEQVKS
jgi:hypothetical protein